MIEFYCPHCDKLLKTSPDRAGLEAKCPGCGELVVVPTPSTEGDQFGEPHDAVVDDHSDVRCPVCGEPILPHQSRCSLCGAAFERDQSNPERLSRQRETRPFPPGEVISEAVRIWSKRWPLLAAAFLLKCVLIGLPAVVLLGLFAIVQSAFVPNQQGNDDVVVGILLGGTLLLTLLTLALTTYLQAGSFVLHLKVARQQPASIGDLFAGGPYWSRMFVCGLLVNLMICLAAIACFIPSLIVQAIFLPYGYILVGENRSSLDCLSRSKELTDGNWGSLLLLVILSIACYYVGMIACYIGLVLTVPLVDLFSAVAYERMLQQTPMSKLNSDS
ncbi:bL32 family ribosomal protein [Schlesneria paludicola]|uniref:hypothetical protein n=1 Tax=Schlesneria paludicola TaxID=360056 RepID=UPI000299E1C7|nr:hypothetical protein [Schlesneria paludicola]